nr:prenyltransferase [uncultured Megasphaera sp.]
MGIVAAVSSTFDFSVLPVALPLIISIGLIMMTNNTSDIEKDREAKRRTLPALLGRKKAVRLYRAAVWLWMALICILPVGYFGMWGLISPVLFIVFARHTFVNLLRSPLVPQGRVGQMKGIIAANLFGNGAYLATLALVLFGGGTLG